MKTGLTKKQKTTVICFDESGDLIEVQTYNTDLKNRLTKFAAMYPEHCRQTDSDEQGELTFEIEKGRLSFRLTAPYSEERRKAASDYALEENVPGVRIVSGGMALHAVVVCGEEQYDDPDVIFRPLLAFAREHRFAQKGMMWGTQIFVDCSEGIRRHYYDTYMIFG